MQTGTSTEAIALGNASEAKSILFDASADGIDYDALTYDEPTPEPLEIGGTATLPGLSAEGGVSLSDPPITLSDFVVPTGRLLANSALITAGRNAQNFLLRTDTGTLGTLEDGDFPANITRIRDRGPNDFQLNDNPNIADIEAFFATGGDGSDYWIHIQDAGGVASIEASTLDTGASNANNARFDSTSAFDTIVSRIADGDLFIIAFTEPDVPDDLEVGGAATMPGLTAAGGVELVDPEPAGNGRRCHDCRGLTAEGGVEFDDPTVMETTDTVALAGGFVGNVWSGAVHR